MVTMVTYEVKITETIRNYLKADSFIRNYITEEVETIQDIREFLSTRYGCLPGGRNKIYIDGKDGKSIPIGFLHSFWDRCDYPHDSKAFLQTDWIEIGKITRESVDYKDIGKGTVS